MSSYSNFQSDRIKNANVQDMFVKPRNQLKKQTYAEEFEERLIDWVTFYRRNLHRFVEHYFGIKLHLYQKILLYLMNFSSLDVIVACRAASKSYLIAIYACAMCVLKPGSKVVIASATKNQAKLIVTEKIKKELIPNCPNLALEIKDIKTNANDIEVFFHNSSSIIVVPATDNARGVRGTINIYEEFRLIKKDIIDSVLSPFLFVRPVPYLKNPKYEHLKEEPTEIYISSSYFKSHWMWDLIKLSTSLMYKTGEAMMIGFDYSITLKHGIKTKKQILKEKKKMDSTTFAMEYQNLMVGNAENAYFSFELLNKAQKIKKAFYPRKDIDVIEGKKNKFDIPKQKGEIRVVAVDIAMITNAQGKNDNTAIHCIRALPFKDYYERQDVYVEAFNGGNTTEQALRIKQIFYDFDGDYVVLDTQNSGINVADELGKILYDDKRDVEYPAWKCFNDENAANRIKIKNAKDIIFGVKASAAFNHEMHMDIKDKLEKGRLKLLINSAESKDYLDTKKEYVNADSMEKTMFELPYIQTELTINEMVNLSYEINPNSKTIKLSEPSSGTKDRYTALAYGNHFISILERDLIEDKTDTSAIDFLFIN